MEQQWPRDLEWELLSQDIHLAETEPCALLPDRVSSSRIRRTSSYDIELEYEAPTQPPSQEIGPPGSLLEPVTIRGLDRLGRSVILENAHALQTQTTVTGAGRVVRGRIGALGVRVQAGSKEPTFSVSEWFANGDAIRHYPAATSRTAREAASICGSERDRSFGDRVSSARLARCRMGPVQKCHQRTGGLSARPTPDSPRLHEIFRKGDVLESFARGPWGGGLEEPRRQGGFPRFLSTQAWAQIRSLGASCRPS